MEKIKLIVSIIFTIIIVFIFGGICGGYYINNRWIVRDKIACIERERAERESTERIKELEDQLFRFTDGIQSILDSQSDIYDKIIGIADFMLETNGDHEIRTNSSHSDSDSRGDNHNP